jgi:hypothetical protein
MGLSMLASGPQDLTLGVSGVAPDTTGKKAKMASKEMEKILLQIIF